MIATLESLRDIGNTVIVVEHDEDTIRAADHVVEMGPGPGVHGGKVVVQGTLARRARVQGVAHRAVPLRQARDRRLPQQRRKGNGKALVVRGARENNLKSDRRERSRSARSSRSPAPRARARARSSTTMLYKALWKKLEDTRTLPGRARRRRRARARAQGGEHRPVARSAATAARTRRPTSASTTRSAICSRSAPLSVERDYKAGPLQLQRQGRPLRGVPGRRRRSRRSSTSCPTSR